MPVLKKYLPKKIKQSCLLILCSSLPLIAHSSTNHKNTLPEIGTVAASTLTIAQDITLGQFIRRQLRSTSPIIYDPLLDEYINDLGNKLLVNAQDVKYPFSFSIIKDNAINAFATFGGTVVLNSRTIIESESESELASVLAHEISHVTQRHIARRTEKMKDASGLTTASMIGAIALALINPSLGQAALISTLAGGQQLQLNYTRHNEKEADRVGLGILIDSDFDPRGSINFLGRLAEQNRYTTKLPPMLYSHPLSDTRVSDMRSRVDGLPHQLYKENPEYQLMRTRVITRYSLKPEFHVSNFSKLLKNASLEQRPIYQYGLALALSDNKQYKEALAIVDQLRQGNLYNLYYIDLLSDIYTGLKEYDKLDKMLSDLSLQLANNQVILLNRANALIINKQFEQASELLKDYLLIKPDNHLAWQLITDAYKGQNKLSQYHQAKAEVLAQRLQFSEAIDALHTATVKLDKKDNSTRKRISGRIKQLRDEQEKFSKTIAEL